MNNIEKDYIFVIYSCKKNLEKAKDFYNRYHGIMENNLSIKVFVMYGDNIKNDYEILDNKYLVINVDDSYDFLYLKSLKLFKILNKNFPKIKGCFKCDDDIVLNFYSIITFIENLKYFSIDYSGKVVISIQNKNNNKHIIMKNTGENKIIETPSTIYCGGPLYYLSKRSLETIEKTNIKNVEHMYYEDLITGYILNKNNIYPIQSKLYTDEIFFYNHFFSYHNMYHKNILFMRIHGGLGNQMFQIASGYGIAKKNNMDFFIINSSNILKNDFTHTQNNNFFVKSIFNKFPTIDLEVIKLGRINIYNEEGKDCFIFNDIVLKEDTLLNGYFQNEKYFIDYKSTIVESFKDNNIYKNIFNSIKVNEDIQSFMKNCYFLHVRRGDYVNNTVHQINYNTYYSKAISYILEKDENACFYIVSDDIEFCKTYNVLNNINKYFYENNDPLETIYFMSFCCKGGICCNSTFSWWGSYLNNNRNKIILFPNKWINNDWVVDIQYENSILIEV